MAMERMTLEYFQEAAWELVKDLPVVMQADILGDLRTIQWAIDFPEDIPLLTQRTPVSGWVIRIARQHFFQKSPLTLPPAVIEAALREDPLTPVVECLTCGYPQPAEFTRCILCSSDKTGPDGSYGKKLADRAKFN